MNEYEKLGIKMQEAMCSMEHAGKSLARRLFDNGLTPIQFDADGRPTVICLPKQPPRQSIATKRAHLSVLARLLDGLGSPAVVREVARQRVDAAIAAYRGPFAHAVAAGLRAAAERCDLTERQVESAIATMVDYEDRRGVGVAPVALAVTEAIKASWLRCGHGYGYVGEVDTLNVYERERSRC